MRIKPKKSHPWRWMPFSPSSKKLGTSDADAILFESKVKCKIAIDSKQTVRFPGKRK